MHHTHICAHLSLPHIWQLVQPSQVVRPCRNHNQRCQWHHQQPPLVVVNHVCTHILRATGMCNMLLKPLVPQNAGLGSHRTWYLGWDVDQAIMVSKRMNDLVWLPIQQLSVENLSSFIFLHMYVCIICTPNGVLWELKLCYCLPYGTLIVPLNILTLPPWGVPCRSPLVHFNCWVKCYLNHRSLRMRA